MLREIIESSKDVKILYNNKYYQDKTLTEFYFKTLEGSYFTPSYNYADDNMLKITTMKGFWIEINFDKVMSFKDYKFSKLIVPIKPRCNWLTFYRCVDNVYDGKCLNLSISSTTDLYNILRSTLDEK
jgi:hypothetical protein